MVWLSEPAASDCLLDSFCGSGTIIAERLAYPAAAVWGGDLSPVAVAAAVQNLGGTDRAVVRQWDARCLPVDAHAVDRVVSNLPFGHQVAAPQEIPELYAGFARELRRVLRPGGTAILLTDRQEALRQAVEGAGLRQEELLLVSLKGRHPRVCRIAS